MGRGTELVACSAVELNVHFATAGMSHFTCFVTILLATGGSCASLSWGNLNAGGLIRSRWFAGTAYANNLLYVFGGQGTGFRVSDSGILGEMGRLING